MLPAMREKLLTLLLLIAIGVIAHDKLTVHAKAASSTLRLYTSEPLWDTPAVFAGDSGLRIGSDMHIDGTVHGFSCIAKGNKTACYVLASD
jgi:hypothetical protein